MHLLIVLMVLVAELLAFGFRLVLHHVFGLILDQRVGAKTYAQRDRLGIG